MYRLCKAIAEELTKRHTTLSVAESCTGGLISQRITQVPGISSVFVGSIVVYSNLMKIKLLGVPELILQKYGAVSEECAFHMADGVRKTMQSDWGLSVTGIAGPSGGMPNKPVGTVYFGISHERRTIARKIHISDQGRQVNREEAAWIGLQWLLSMLTAGPQGW